MKKSLHSYSQNGFFIISAFRKIIIFHRNQARGCSFDDLELFQMKSKEIFKLQDIIEIFVQLAVTNPNDSSSIVFYFSKIGIGMTFLACLCC